MLFDIVFFFCSETNTLIYGVLMEIFASLIVLCFLYMYFFPTTNNPVHPSKPKSEAEQIDDLYRELMALVDEPIDLSPPVDTTPIPDWSAVKPLPYNQFMSAANKALYLRSPKWRALRQQRLLIAGYSCEVEGCTNTHKLNCHHVDYTYLGDEPIEHLRIVCEHHHAQIHQILGYDRTTLFPINIVNSSR